MPRTARASVGGVCYHVINRGNGRSAVIRNAADFQAFEELVRDACQRLPMRVLSYCLIPNHFHLILWPWNDGDLSRWMQWLLTAHVRRYHKHYQSSGTRPGSLSIYFGSQQAWPFGKADRLVAISRGGTT